MNEYWVVIEPVDVSNDSFKQNVKLVVQALAKINGSPNFTANIYDDEVVANARTTLDPSSPGQPHPTVGPQAVQTQHYVASYEGRLPAENPYAEHPYEIWWYPAAYTDSPNVGRYVHGEPWKP